MHAPSLYCVPLHDKPEFSQLPEPCRIEIRDWLRGLAEAQAAPRIGAGLERLAFTMGLSVKRTRQIYDAFRHSGDWRVLINRAKYQPVRQPLPTAFVEYWKALCEENQRKSAPAYRELIRRWRRGDAIPGYDSLPSDCGLGHPEGWSESNLCRSDRYAPSSFEATAMREGLGAAMAGHGPQVLTTRVGLWVGSHYIIDDVKRDMEVLLISNGAKKAQIQELGVLDLLSADRFAVHRRPMFIRDSDGKMDSVKEREMRFLVAAVLRNTGWSRRGTEFVTEKGTAAIRKPLATWLHDTLSSDITVRGPGMTGKEQVVAGYWGRGGGNPRHKAPLESHHNLLQNEAANLPAQTGHDMHYPEWLHGIDAITDDVIEWLAKLPPNRGALLRAPMLEYWQALGLLADIDQRIAWRTKHELEGWIESGFTTIEFRRDIIRDEWLNPQEFLALPPGEQAVLAAAADKYPEFRRARKLAPREVFAAGAADLVKAPDHLIALMFCDRDLGDDLRVTKKLSADGTIHLEASEFEPERMTFERELVAPDGGTHRLADNERFSVVLNVFDRDALWIYDQRGGFLGTAPRRQRVSPLDEHGIQIALGERSHAKAELLGPLRDRHAGADAAIAELQAHNDRVKAGAAVTPEAKAAERETRARIASERATMSGILASEQQSEQSEEDADIPSISPFI